MITDTSHLNAFVHAFEPPLGVVSTMHQLAFAPATHIAQEWREYIVACPGATWLQVGLDVCKPLHTGVFRLRFENQLGLTSIQPFQGTTPLTPPLHIEVISPKFPEPGAHLTFLQTLMNDLFARAARLPFTIVAPTSRGVDEALQPPSPLFILHFLCQYGPALRAALATVLASPHRVLTDRPERVPLAEVSEVGPDVLISIIQSPEELVPARGLAVARYLGKWVPQRVLQRLPEETFDTPENRFVLSFVHVVLNAAEALPLQKWWRNVPDLRQRLVRDVIATLRHTLAHPVFDDVGPLTSLPAASQVLLRREGYKEIRELWQHFQHARRPLFEPMRHAIELRDIATLYEVWCFFALVEDIAAITGDAPALELKLSDIQGLGWSAAARFGRDALIYNAYGQSYSVPLRPDYTWRKEGRPTVVLDAKFRLDRGQLESTEAERTSATTAKLADIYKMHTYRDALGVRAAVIVYPGDTRIYYDQRRRRIEHYSLSDVLFGNLSGVGAIPLRP